LTFLTDRKTKEIPCTGCKTAIHWPPESQLQTHLGNWAEPALCGACKRDLTEAARAAEREALRHGGHLIGAGIHAVAPDVSGIHAAPQIETQSETATETETVAEIPGEVRPQGLAQGLAPGLAPGLAQSLAQGLAMEGQPHALPPSDEATGPGSNGLSDAGSSDTNAQP
jgi:hypothetical protein